MPNIKNFNIIISTPVGHNFLTKNKGSSKNVTFYITVQQAQIKMLFVAIQLQWYTIVPEQIKTKYLLQDLRGYQTVVHF